MKCYSIQKEDDFVTVCVLCTLSFVFFGGLDYYHRILSLTESLMPVHARRCTRRGFYSKEAMRRRRRSSVSVSFQILSFQSLSIVNIWKTQLSVAQFHYQTPPLCPSPPLHVFFSLSEPPSICPVCPLFLAVSAILYSAALGGV